MFCSECGKQVVDNAKFCANCGTSIAVTAEAQLLETKASPANSSSHSSPSQLKVSSSTNPKKLLILLLVIAGVIGMLVLAISKTNENAPEAQVIAKTANETKAQTESEFHILTEDELGHIPFSDRVDDAGEPNADAKDFEKNWKGKIISLKYGGIKVSENFVFCEPEIKGLNPNSVVTGTLDSRTVGGSGGNPITLKNCKVEKTEPDEKDAANVQKKDEEAVDNAAKQSSSNLSLSEIGTQIGAEKIVECILESSAMYVRTSNTSTKQGRDLNMISFATMKAYTDIAEAYQPHVELGPLFDSYNARVGQRPDLVIIKTISDCVKEPLALPIVQKYGKNI